MTYIWDVTHSWKNCVLEIRGLIKFTWKGDRVSGRDILGFEWRKVGMLVVSVVLERCMQQAGIPSIINIITPNKNGILWGRKFLAALLLGFPLAWRKRGQFNGSGHCSQSWLFQKHLEINFLNYRWGVEEVAQQFIHFPCMWPIRISIPTPYMVPQVLPGMVPEHCWVWSKNKTNYTCWCLLATGDMTLQACLYVYV